MGSTIFKTKEEAISPVIGIMLMLVVTVIIAAVVSGFAGGLIQTDRFHRHQSLGSTASITALP